MLAKVLVLSLAVATVALKSIIRQRADIYDLANCQRAGGKRQLKSTMSMRKAGTAEMKEEGYLAEPKVAKIFYINQDRAKMRETAMQKKMKQTSKQYEVERFPAIKPNEARKFDLKQYSNGHKNKEVSGKILATYFSHWLILKHIANQTKHNASDHTDVYFVLEDDVEFVRKDWVQQVMCHISKLPADWDMYKFGYWGEVSEKRHGGCGTNNGKTQGLTQFNQYSCFQQTSNVDIGDWIGNQGYAIRPSGAAHMLTYLQHMPVMDVDGAMMPHDAGKSLKFAPNNYFSRETLLEHDTKVNLENVNIGR